jgi:low affinity Fe/Cu permease
MDGNGGDHESAAGRFAKWSSAAAHAVGRPRAFLTAVALVLLWAVTGPFFGFSDTWQLVINTGTTIVTFLMVFLIQNTQNRDGAAIQAKLDELIRTSAAQNTYIGIERLTEDELDEVRRRCEARAQVLRAADGAEATANDRAEEAARRATGAS